MLTDNIDSSWSSAVERGKAPILLLEPSLQILESRFMLVLDLVFAVCVHLFELLEDWDELFLCLS